MSSTTDNEQRFAYLLSPEFQIVNTAGKPLTGGWIEVYIHGTRVKYYCFSDFDGTLHPFQIPLDSLGSNIVLASPTHAYDIYIYNKFGALVMSRYNVVPACNAADIVEDVVVIDSPDETINVTCDGGSNWHLEVNTDLIATTEQLASVSGDLQDQIDNKKDLQLPYVASGSVTKTITKIEQNENGEIEVTYSDIDLPPQVPNIDIISPSGTIDVSSTVNPATNTKTFKIDIHKTKMDFFDGYCGKSHYEDRSSSSTSAFGLYVDQWDEYKYQGDFIANSWQDENNTTFKLNSGLYLITASIRYQMNNDYNKEEYIRIATGAYNGLENGTRYKDWSYEKELGDGTAESSIQVSFIRNVEDDDDYTYMNGNHDLYLYPYLPVGVNYAFIDHLQIVKLDSIAAAGGGSGPRYAAGYGIEILDDVIQVATGTVVTNNYFNTVVSSINNEINEISTTIQNVTGDITELNEAVTNIVGVTGDFATNEDLQIVSGAIPESQEVEFQELDVDSLATTEYVDNRIASAAGDVYEAGQYVSIENNVINVTGVQPEGDYATNEDLQIVSGAIPESQEVEFEELDLTAFAQASAVTVIKNQINNVTGDINNINEAVTNIIGATGDYATEEYVDEAIAAVTGQPFEQVNSDWLATSGVAEILNKPDVFQLIAGDNIDITASGNDLVISASGDVNKAYVDEQVAEVSAAIPESEEVEFQEIDIDNYALASAIPSLDGYATEEYVDNKVASATFEQVNSDWLATSGVAEILNKPLEANIVAGQNISIVQEYDNVIISATGIPSLDGYATEQYVDEAIVAATGMIPEAQVNADWLATSGKAEILNKPQAEAVEFEEVNLEDYALASAIPDVSNFVTQQDVDDSIAPVQSQIDTLAAATGDYITSLDGYATEQYVDDAIATVTGIIPSDVVTEQELADAIDAATGIIPDVAPIQSQIDTLAAATGDYLQSSDLNGYATETYVDAAVTAVDSNIFWAIYGTTTYTDTLAAYNAGKKIFMKDGAVVAACSIKGGNPDTFYFNGISQVWRAGGPTFNYYSLSSRDGWYRRTDFTLQADWNETNNYYAGYIKNKPDLSVYATEQYVQEAIAASGGTDYTAGDHIVIEDNTISVTGTEDLTIKSLVAGENVTITASGDDVILSVTGIDATDIFWAVYNSTTYAEIQAAKQAGKKVFVVDNNAIYVPTYYSGNGWINASFGDPLHSEGGYPHLNRVWIDSNNVWHSDNFTIPYRGTNGVVVNGGEISVTGYATEQYVDTAVAGYATEAYVDSVVTGYATEAYVDAAVSAVTGSSFEQVNADWDATSGVAEILNKPEILDVTVGNVIAGDNISITASGDDIVISAQGGGGATYTAGDNIDITNDTISVTGTEDLTLMPITGVNGVSITNNNGVITFSGSNDETVLYTATAASDSITTSEEVTHFERLRIELQSAQSTYVKNCVECIPDANNLVYTGTALIPAADYPLQMAGVRYTSSNAKNFTFSYATRMCYRVNGTYGDSSTTTLANSDIKDVGFITKIVGINRK